jgi:hypothetical protein
MKMLLASLCVSLALVASCGGGSGGTCGNAPACGGNIVGSWQITSSCITVDVSQMSLMTDCPGETFTAAGWAITGNVTYKADMTYASSSTTTGKVVIGLPASCLTSQGLTLTCEQVTQLLQADLAGEGFQSGQCVSSGGGCSCTLAIIPLSAVGNGTYSTTAAGVLTELDSGGATSDVNDYCISGTTLTLSPHAGSGMMAQASISGSITLAKQ